MGRAGLRRFISSASLRPFMSGMKSSLNSSLISGFDESEGFRARCRLEWPLSRARRQLGGTGFLCPPAAALPPR